MKIELNYAIFCCAIFALSFWSGITLQAVKARRTTVNVESTITGRAQPANVVAAPNLQSETTPESRVASSVKPTEESRFETFVVEGTTSVQKEDVEASDISFD